VSTVQITHVRTLEIVPGVVEQELVRQAQQFVQLIRAHGGTGTVSIDLDVKDGGVRGIRGGFKTNVRL